MTSIRFQLILLVQQASHKYVWGNYHQTFSLSSHFKNQVQNFIFQNSGAPIPSPVPHAQLPHPTPQYFTHKAKKSPKPWKLATVVSLHFFHHHLLIPLVGLHHLRHISTPSTNLSSTTSNRPRCFSYIYISTHPPSPRVILVYFFQRDPWVATYDFEI